MSGREERRWTRGICAIATLLSVTLLLDGPRGLQVAVAVGTLTVCLAAATRAIVAGLATGDEARSVTPPTDPGAGHDGTASP